jgi:hypothetical protein
MRELIKDFVNDLNIEVNYKQYNLKNQSEFYIIEVIKTLFAIKGRKLGFEIASRKNILANVDFLFDKEASQFDLEWFKLIEENKLSIKNVSLGLEIKLDCNNFDEFKFDFVNLLEAKKYTKIFITTSTFMRQKVKYIQKVILKNESFTLNENLYLIIYHMSENGEFLLKEFRK